MADHGSRAHATWAASASARNTHCAGALALAVQALEGKESIHSAKGTAGHQVADKCLRTGAEPISFLGTIERTKEHDIEIDEELIRSIEMYVDYVREVGRRAVGEDPMNTFDRFWIEERFSLAALNTPFDAGGTADAVIYDPSIRTLEVVDFKNGRGVVDAAGNPQLRTYALGAMLHHKGLDVEWVKVTIVQPRAEHKDGRIRSETFHVADLVEWTADLMAAMHRSRQAMDERAAAAGNSVLLDEWAEKWLRPGACRWCPVEGSCPALRSRAIDRQNGIAQVWFEDDGSTRIANQPGEMSPEALAQTLSVLDELESWIAAVRGHAHTLAEHGVEIPGYQLVNKVSRDRKWAAVEEKVIYDLKNVVGLSDEEIYTTPVLKSVAQIEKVLGSKRKDAIKNMWHKPPVVGTNLVSAAKTNRPPAQPLAEQYFETV